MMYPLHGFLYFKNEKKRKEHFQIPSVASPTCERKQIIAEFMFLDSSKMEKNLMLSPVAQVCFLELKWELEQYLCKCIPIYALLYWTYGWMIFKIMAWCWNHTEAGSNTKIPHISKSLGLDDPMKFWLWNVTDSEDKLLQTPIISHKNNKVQN